MVVFKILLVASVCAVLLAMLGFGVFFLIGLGAVSVFDISCFEGGCGTFAAMVAAAGAVVGAVLGMALGTWIVLRGQAQIPDGR